VTDLVNRLAPSANRVLELAMREALSLGKNAIEAEHIVMALARNAQANHRDICSAFDLLKDHYGRSTT
jgi:hypothetical protein